ncbi:MAG: hybrid sensor histidine kinase/response regulator [Cytophagaceae bacterium]|nr:hybrid sensor histidine kinase/response regulator [Gemmatimonadaceae bacterium]
MSAPTERLSHCTILLVDDEEANLDLLEALLGTAGYTHLVRTRDPREVLSLVEAHRPDLILLDLHMPHRHGFDVLADLRAVAAPGEYRPVLVLTADVTPETRDRALSLGARDFVIKPFDATEVLLRVENLLETRQLHVAERAARARAEEATRERERLLAVVAHDLRNPLAVVAMYAETLLRGGRVAGASEDAEWEQAALTTISANTGTMQRLVEDLLDASSMRGDGLRIHRVTRRVGDAFESARVMLAPLAEAAGVLLAFVGDEQAAEAVGTIDPERIAQLLSNLVGNAVKFTPSGGRVEVRFAVQGSVLHASVTDSGPGISATELPHLFTAFWTGEQKVGGGRNGHGAGLGLWIARGIAEAHGGELEAESRLGEGATFRFRIPLAHA